jgi:cob(I)alamin adenosyltransferase
MPIYTKKGDKGQTKVFDKKTGQLTPVAKDSCHIETIGAIDELNSFLGIVNSHYDNMNYHSDIRRIQGNLFIINSILAGSKLKFGKTKTKKLEKEIDEWEKILPVQKNFIFYGGNQTASLLFYARALCRKAERSLVGFSTKYVVSSEILQYINRLSDYLFILARGINSENKVKEEFWITHK